MTTDIEYRRRSEAPPKTLLGVVWGDGKGRSRLSRLRVFTSRDEAETHLAWVRNGWDKRAELVRYSLEVRS